MTDAASNEIKIAGAQMGLFTAPDQSVPLAEQPADVLFAMLLFGEARGESRQALRAVAQVVVNRAKFPHRVFGSRAELRFEENLRRVILQPYQFSCFLPEDLNYRKLLRPLCYEDAWVWRRCLDTAREAMAQRRRADQFTANSDHYFDESLQPPNWADPAKQTAAIGRLRFYRLYLPSPQAEAGTSSRAEAPASRLPAAEEAAAAGPSLRASSPPSAVRRAATAFLRVREGTRRQHCRDGAGCGSHMSTPAPHHLSQRSPRLGLNRWSLWSRGLSSLRSVFGMRASELGIDPLRAREQAGPSRRSGSTPLRQSEFSIGPLPYGRGSDRNCAR